MVGYLFTVAEGYGCYRIWKRKKSTLKI